MSCASACGFLGGTGSIVIVLTPLISLMIDQKDKFVKKGIQAEFVGQAQEDEEAVAAVIRGDIQLVYISPENLLCSLPFRNMLLSDKYRNKLRALAIDEAHCIKLWLVVCVECIKDDKFNVIPFSIM